MASTCSFPIMMMWERARCSKAGFWVKVRLCNPTAMGSNPNSDISWLDSPGQTQEKQPKEKSCRAWALTEEREMDHSREGNVHPWLAACNPGRAAPRLSPGLSGRPRTSIQVSPQLPPETAQHTHKSNSSSLVWSLWGVITWETVQTLEARAGSCSGLDEMQYNEDANKRTRSLPTHCLPTPPGHISDTQPVIPMERKGTSEQRVHTATHPHTAVLSLQT